jgi:hypothetical protein
VIREKGIFVRTEKSPKKPYFTSQLRQLEFEQAAVFLVGHAYNNGDPEALALLEVMFPDPAESQIPKTSREDIPNTSRENPGSNL